MTLSLLDQWTATQQDTVQHKVTMAAYNAAIIAMSAAAPTAPVTQGQRDALIAAILKQANYATATFIGYIVSDPAVNVLTDINDAQITGRLTTGVFDSAAHRLYPNL